MKKTWLRLISVLLTVSLLSSCLGIASSAQSENPLSIQVVTDVHYRPLASIPDVSTIQSMPDSELYSHASYNAQLYAESEAVVKEFLIRAAGSEANTIIIPGDLVDGALKASHIALAKLFKNFENTTNKKIFLINGNNDISSNNPSCASNTDFAEIYADFGFNEALYRDPSSLSYSIDLDENYRLLAIDSCIYGASNGVINPAVLAWIEEQAKIAKNDNKKLVAMMHHALLKHFGGFGDILLDAAPLDGWVDNADTVWEEFADLGIQYLFTGHMHANSITKGVSKAGNEIYDVETNALQNYPCSYRTVIFSNANVDIKTQTIDHIDLNNLAPGYTPQQLDLIETDFRQYAYGYIAVSAQYMMKEYFLYPQNAVNRLRLDSESELAKLLIKILPDAYTCFTMPLYKTADTNGCSIEETAAQGGYTLPQSGYKNFFEVLNVIIGNYTCGDANMPGNAMEVQLLIACLKAVLVYSLAANGNILTPAIVQQFTAYTGITFTDAELKAGLSSLVFKQTLANKLTDKVLQRFLEDVTTDAYAPGDVNVTLPAYPSTLSQTQPGFFENILRLIQDIFNTILKLVSIFD